MPWGLVLQNLKAPAVIEVRYGSVVAQENPHVLLPEVATSLFSFCFLSCRLLDFNGVF